MFFKTFAEKQRERKGDRYDSDLRRAKRAFAKLDAALTQARAERDALALQVLILTNERDEARARPI